MKKRIMGLLMATLLCIGTVVPVSAANQIIDNEGKADVLVTYDNYSSFCVNIPESIDLNNYDGYIFTADFINILDTEKVCVYPPEGGIDMTNQYGDHGSVTMYVTQGKDNAATFLRGQTEAEYPMYGQFDGFAAGHFEGTATFTVRLEPNNQ